MQQKALVLMYHNIAEPPPGAGLRSLYVTPRMFRFQMWYLKTAGFRVVPLEEVAAAARGTTTGRRLVALTFDDGFEDFHLNAWPVLQAHGYPATVFLVASRVGGENSWDTSDVGVSKKLLSWEQITEMSGGKVSFGSHTLTHPFLSRLSPQQLREEVSTSKKVIEDRLDLPAQSFCYPSGDYDQRVIDAVRESGYCCAVTTQRGSVHSGDDPYTLRRSFIRLNTHPFLFLLKMHSSYEDRKGGRI